MKWVDENETSAHFNGPAAGSPCGGTITPGWARGTAEVRPADRRRSLSAQGGLCGRAVALRCRASRPVGGAPGLERRGLQAQVAGTMDRLVGPAETSASAAGDQ